jgi:hypothetical protein
MATILSFPRGPEPLLPGDEAYAQIGRCVFGLVYPGDPRKGVVCELKAAHRYCATHNRDGQLDDADGGGLMAHHKRGRPKSRRAGCTCHNKVLKQNGFTKLVRLKGRSGPGVVLKQVCD